MRTDNSIMPKSLYYSTERFAGSELHHIFYGTANRKLSDEDGLFVFLTPEAHRGRKGAHFDKDFDLYLKRKAQQAWQDYYGKSEYDFIRRYGRSYI